MAEDDERMKQVQEVFDRYDIEKDGTIKTFEIVNALGSLESNATQEDVDSILNDLNLTETSLNLKEFKDVVEYNDAREEKAALIEAFNYFDKGKKGYITYDQLAKILKPMLGNEITEDELKDMVIQADSDNSGTIEIKEFCDFLSQ